MATTAARLGFADTKDTLYAYDLFDREIGVIDGLRTAAPNVTWMKRHKATAAIAIDQRHARLALGFDKVHICDLSGQEEQIALSHHYPAATSIFWSDACIQTISWSPDGLFLFTQSSEAYDFAVWDVTMGITIYRDFQKIGWSRTTPEWVREGAVSPNGELLAVAFGRSSDVAHYRNTASEIRLYDLRMTCLAHFERLSDTGVILQKMEFSPDGRYLVVHEGYQGGGFPRSTPDEYRAWSKKSRLTVYEVVGPTAENDMSEHRAADER